MTMRNSWDGSVSQMQGRTCSLEQKLSNVRILNSKWAKLSTSAEMVICCWERWNVSKRMDEFVLCLVSNCELEIQARAFKVSETTLTSRDGNHYSKIVWDELTYNFIRNNQATQTLPSLVVRCNFMFTATKLQVPVISHYSLYSSPSLLVQNQNVSFSF